MRAALSHSLSRGAGQYASLPKRTAPAVVDGGLLLRFAGVLLLLSAHEKTLSRAASEGLDLWPDLALLLLGFDLSHEGSRAETRCMMGCFPISHALTRTHSTFLVLGPRTRKMGGDWRRREEERNQRQRRRWADGGERGRVWIPTNGCGMFAKEQALFAGGQAGGGCGLGEKARTGTNLAGDV